MTERDARIREIAYFLWLEEGRPEGQAERHWRTAEALERKRVEGEPPGDIDLPADPGLPGAEAAPRTPSRRTFSSG